MQHFLPDNPRLRQTAIILLLLAATFVQAKLTMTSVATHSHALPLGTVEASVIDDAPYRTAWAHRYAVPAVLVAVRWVSGGDTVFAARLLLLLFLLAANIGLYRLLRVSTQSDGKMLGALLLHTVLYAALLHPYFALWDLAEIALWYWTFHALKKRRYLLAVLLAVVGMLNRESGILQLAYVTAAILIARYEAHEGGVSRREMLFAGMAYLCVAAVYLFLMNHFREAAGTLMMHPRNQGVLLSGNEIWIWTNIKTLLKVHQYFAHNMFIVVVLYFGGMLALAFLALRKRDASSRLLGVMLLAWIGINFMFGLIEESRDWLASIPVVMQTLWMLGARKS